jgi:hypothetical protein
MKASTETISYIVGDAISRHQANFITLAVWYLDQDETPGDAFVYAGSGNNNDYVEEFSNRVAVVTAMMGRCADLAIDILNFKTGPVVSVTEDGENCEIFATPELVM